jgi:hypothetical protein
MDLNFKKDGFQVIRNLFDPEYIKVLQTYFDLKYRLIQYYEEEKKLRSTYIANKDVSNSFYFYADTLTETTSLLYGPVLCHLLGLNLSPTYTYTRIYEKTGILLPHIDRPACEVSLTCPITISDNRASTIFISNYVATDKKYTLTLEEVKSRGDYTQVDLMPGDALVYSGCDRVHWRESLESEYLIQFFMHYITTDGKNASQVFDGRPYMGFQRKE